MKIFNGIREYEKQEKPLVLAMGMFDGVHLGHQKILFEAKELAKKLDGIVFVLTFDTHPKKLLNPEKDFAFLTTNQEKIEILKNFKIDGVLFLYFDERTASMSYEKFIKEELINKLNIKGLVVGEDFRFGRAKEGDVELLKNLSEKYRFYFKAVKNIKYKSIYNFDSKISSTLIKQELYDGNLDTANLNLGYNFFIRNKIIKGLQIARKFSVPTANLHIPIGKILPAGVFAGITKLGEKQYHSVISVGNRQTLEHHNQLCLETHILDFDRDIYGEEIRVSFLNKIREQKKFDSLQLLFAQIDNDIQQTRNYFTNLKEKKIESYSCNVK